MSIALETLSQSAHRALRESYLPVLRISVLVAVLLHLVAGMFSPPLVPRPIRLVREVPLEWIRMADEIHVLPPPPAVQRPRLDAGGEILPVEDPVDLAPMLDQSERVFAPPPVLTPEEPRPFQALPSRAPEVLHMEAPTYPELAKMSGSSGMVVVRITIDVRGRVRNATVVRSGVVRALEEAALVAVRQWIFTPAQQGGQPVEVQLEVPFAFTLN